MSIDRTNESLPLETKKHQWFLCMYILYMENPKENKQQINET